MAIDDESKKNLEKRIAKNARKAQTPTRGSSKEAILRGRAVRKEATRRFNADKAMLARMTEGQTSDSNNK